MIKIPKVSVYIPVYNYGKYVKKAIDSIINQTFDDWELIVINDGSSDESEEIIAGFESHPKITTVSQKNKGLAVTCNIALRLSSGKYIMRLDGDDYLDENALLVMVSFLDKHPEIGLVYPDYYLVNENGDIISMERRERINGGEDFLLDLPPHGACTMFRRNILIELGGYSEDITCQDGYDIWFRFLDLYKADNVNLPLFYYRQHPGSLTGNDKKILETRQLIKRKYIERRSKKDDENSKLSRIAIVPVREHSNVTAKMALVEIAGRPMIDYTLRETIGADCFNRIVVVSEDDEILHYVGSNYGNIMTMKRPMELSRRNTKLEDTIELVLNNLEENQNEIYDEVMLLYSQAPLKRREHIIKAIDTMHIFDTDCVVPLCETVSPYYVRGKNGLQRIGSSERFRLERETIYKGNGVLFLFKTKNLRDGGSIIGKRIGHIIMLREDSVNICSKYDFEVAQFLLMNRADSLPIKEGLTL